MSGKAGKVPSDDRVTPSLLPKKTTQIITEKYKVNENTTFSNDATKRLGAIIEELSGWIVTEAEHIAISRGSNKIGSEDVLKAVKIFFGERRND